MPMGLQSCLCEHWYCPSHSSHVPEHSASGTSLHVPFIRQQAPMPCELLSPELELDPEEGWQSLQVPSSM